MKQEELLISLNKIADALVENNNIVKKINNYWKRALEIQEESLNVSKRGSIYEKMYAVLTDSSISLNQQISDIRILFALDPLPLSYDQKVQDINYETLRKLLEVIENKDGTPRSIISQLNAIVEASKAERKKI